jgi:3-hydroxyisobutyrate dehydrogenase-like beta-hydroxyacid dehydrogenase
MKKSISVGFIGFGEAGSAIAKGLQGEGVTQMSLCHLRQDDPRRVAWVKAQAKEAGVQYRETITEVVQAAQFILSVVSLDGAVAAAQQAVGSLRSGKTYLDLTSSFPDDMKAIAKMIAPTGAVFVDGAMMAAVPQHRHKVLTYVAGPQAGETAELLNAWGMNLKVVGDEPGQASAIKLVLSVGTKGFEAVLVEMLLAAHHFGVENHVLSALNEFFKKGLDSGIHRLVGSDAVHAGRRVKEMESSVKLLESLGVEPLMCRATVQRLRWSASLGLAEYFHGQSPETYQEVIAAWEKIGLFQDGRTSRKK